MVKLKIILTLCAVSFTMLSYSQQSDIDEIDSYDESSVMSDDIEFDNGYKLNFFAAPNYSFRGVDRTTGFLGRKVSLKFTQHTIGIGGGIVLRKNNYVSILTIGAGAGEGNVRLEVPSISLDVTEPLSSKLYTINLSTGYRFGDDTLSITPAFYTNASNNSFIESRDVAVPGVPGLLTTGYKENSTYVQSGFSANGNYTINDKFKLDFRAQLGYIYYANTRIQLTTNSPTIGYDNRNMENFGLFSLLSVVGIYSSPVGQFMISPWIGIQNIYVKNSDDSKTKFFGIAFSYLIGI